MPLPCPAFRRGRPHVLIGVSLVMLALGACSGDDDGGAATSAPAATGVAPGTSTTPAPTTATVATTEPATTTRAPTTTVVARPEGPVADLSEELTGGEGVFIASAVTGETSTEGYAEQEYAATGTAASYQAVGDLTPDGRWSFQAGPTADYRTRVLVRRPTDPAAFSGVVVVEWLNVSGGGDADADWMTLHEEIVREGDVWVGVSAQAIGVEGGDVRVRIEGPGSEDQGKGLKALDPARYGSLSHPGDAFAHDIFSQVARAVRSGDALGGLVPEHVIAIGESQSAFALTSYINGVQPLTHAFDGFFVHSRGASGLPLALPGESVDIASSLGRTPTILRTDTDVPVFEFQTEGDVTGVLSSISARQPDTDLFRLWEVAGTSHADTRLIGPVANSIDCGAPINDGPQHIVAKAALRHLVAWVTEGVLPPTAPLLEVTEGDAPTIQRDADGIALGGVRTPPVDVPTRLLSSLPGPAESAACILFGSTAALSPERIAELYPTRADFEREYNAAVDGAIAAGLILEEDRAAIDVYGHGELVTG